MATKRLLVFRKVYHDGSGFLVDDNLIVAHINYISATPRQFSHWKHNLGKSVFKTKTACVNDAKRKVLNRR